MGSYNISGDRDCYLRILHSKFYNCKILFWECLSDCDPIFFIEFICGQILGNYRNKKLQEFADNQQSFLLSLLYFMMFNLFLAMVGALLTVYLEPAAASDGIAEIKGDHVPLNSIGSD